MTPRHESEVSVNETRFRGMIRKITLGGCQILGGKLVCWSVKKQNSVAMSSVKAGYHFITDHILKGDIELHFVPIDLQLADIFTKPLVEPSFTRLVAELGMLNIDKTLILPSNEVNDVNTTDKSLSGTTMRHVGQPKALNDKKLRKEKIISSSKPKTSTNAKQSNPKKTVNDTQHFEESVTTANATKSLETFESAKELRNQPNPTDSKKEHVTIVEEAMEDPSITNSRTRSLGNVNIDQAVNMEAEEKKEKADSDLKSMSDDEIMSVLRNEDEEADSDRELSVGDEIKVDKFIDTLVSISNKDGADTTVFAASDPTENQWKIADQKAKTIHISGIQLNNSKPNFYRPKLAKENNHGKGASSMTKERETNCSNNIKSRVNYFEALNSLEEDGNVDHIAKEVNKGLSCKPGSSRGVSGESNSMDSMDNFISLCGGDQDLEEDKILHSSVKVAKYILVVNAKHLYTKVERTSNDLHELVELVTQLVRIVDLVSPPVNAATEGEKESQAQHDPAIEVYASAQEEQQSSNASISQISSALVVHSAYAEPPTKKLKVVMKYHIPVPTPLNTSSQSPLITSPVNNTLQISPNLPNLYHFRAAGEGPMTLQEAKLQIQEVKRLADLKATTTVKLGIPPPSQLTAFELHTAEKKCKRRIELIHEVFVKDNIVVDGMQRNLVPPQGVIGSVGLVIREPESGIFVYNGNFDLVFQKENEFPLATTASLIMIQNAIKTNSVEAREMFDKMMYVIEARNDVVEARKIIQGNLDDLG
nr:hypothetical protein [Tanacetum cinerariifolium]